MTGTFTLSIAQKIEFLQEKGYWQNPAGDLTPPQLVEYVRIMMEANEITEEDIHVHFLDDVVTTVVEQVPREEGIEDMINGPSNVDGGHIKLNMDELTAQCSDQNTTDSFKVHGDVRISGQTVGVEGDVEILDNRETHSRVITILTSKYKKELYKWFCEEGYEILETSDMTLSFPGIGMSSRAVGEIMHTIMDSNNYYRVILDWTDESGTGPYPVFIIQGLRGQEDESAMTKVRVHIRLD